MQKCMLPLHTKHRGIPYIPLLLALISNRFIGLVLWNFIIGTLFFIEAVGLCCSSFVKHLQKIGGEEQAEYYISAYDIRTRPDFSDIKSPQKPVSLKKWLK